MGTFAEMEKVRAEVVADLLAGKSVVDRTTREYLCYLDQNQLLGLQKVFNSTGGSLPAGDIEHGRELAAKLRSYEIIPVWEVPELVRLRPDFIHFNLEELNYFPLVLVVLSYWRSFKSVLKFWLK